MAIQAVEEDNRLGIIGKIRLGVRQETQSGKEYPKNVDFFVTKDATDVETYYGENPREIDVFFLSDNLDECLPTWLKWFGAGVRGSDGTVTGGKLKCYGNGPDKNGNPGIAYHVDKKTPDSGIPERACMGERCPDWLDSRGNPQCKWAMQVLVSMPHCNPTGLFQIDTTSKNTIFDLHRQLKTLKMTIGKIAGIPFKLRREQIAVSRWDPKKNDYVKGSQFIMKLSHNPAFESKYGDVRKQIEAVRNSNILLPTQHQLIEAPMEDNYPTIEQGSSSQGQPMLEGSNQLPDKDTVVDAVLKDPEVIDLFGKLELLKGDRYTEKQKKIAVLKKIGAPDVRLAVVEGLAKVVADEERKKAPPPPTKQPIAQDGDGIL